MDAYYETFQKGDIAGGRSNSRDGAPHRDYVLPVRTLGELFPNIELSMVSFPVSQVQGWHEWTMPPLERLTLGAICNYFRPRRIFEIGTYIGASTLIIAINSSPDTEIFTLDLDPASVGTHKHGLGVGGFPAFAPGSAFKGTAVAEKIRQLFGDSQSFDFAPYKNTIDMVFLDADHTYEFVKKDTEAALDLLSPRGIIVWDDYMWIDKHPECAGVTRCINEFSKHRQCYSLAGTRMAIYLQTFSDGVKK